MASEAKRFRAVIKVEALDAQRQVISTTVVATGMENLRRKVVGVIELMDEDDVEDGGA